MKELDDLIEKALDAEDRDILRKFDEQGLFRQAAGVFQGKLAWASVMVTLAALGWFVLAGFSLWKFFTVEEPLLMVRWGAGAMFSITAVAMLKLWFFMQMQTNQVLREVKRVELQIARVQSQVGG